MAPVTSYSTWDRAAHTTGRGANVEPWEESLLVVMKESQADYLRATWLNNRIIGVSAYHMWLNIEAVV